MIERSEPTAINGDCGLVKKTLNLMTGRFFLKIYQRPCTHSFRVKSRSLKFYILTSFVFTRVELFYYRKLENNTVMRFMNFMELALDHTNANQ